MKCIDAIEGTVKSILNGMHAASNEGGLDDSAYVLHAKAIIEGTRMFIVKNPEIVENPQLLVDVLYQYSRNLWLTSRRPAEQGPSSKAEETDSADEEYQTYYYDHLYQRGVYPQ